MIMLKVIKLTSICFLAGLITVGLVAVMVFGTILLGCGPY